MSTRPRYRCVRTDATDDVEGMLDAAAWRGIAWTERFVGIENGCEAPSGLSTRSKLAWNETGLHVFTHLAEPSVVATVTDSGPDILRDPAFELLLDPDGDGRNYYELQINALGTRWELSLPKPYRDGGVADLSGQVAGLRSVVQVHDQGWDVTLTLPWHGLAPFHHLGACPPRSGDRWRMNLARRQWRDGAPSYWVWSQQGEINLHAPSRWGELEFVAARRT